MGALLGECTKHLPQVAVLPEVINPAYIGNGVEWDPYDEVEAWGAPMTDGQWQQLEERLDFMRPQYVRCMINSPYRYYNAQTGSYERDRNNGNILRLLSYCQRHHITVVYGEYNPPTWEMKASQQWVTMAVDYLNFLVQEQGFTCIKHFVIFNEPDGNWASTDGNFSLWLQMLERFHSEMAKHKGLLDKVSLAGPDVVVGYRNPSAPFDALGWLRASAQNANDKIGLYDIHAYPGQQYVRSGRAAKDLKAYRAEVPQGKQIVLGEAGYKYQNGEDTLLWREYQKRAKACPFTEGSDCNMLVYDYFYGVDMALLAAEVMNAGFSGVAAWMLDDAMHTNGDSGKPRDLKIWGMWNSKGADLFADPSQEELRPWFYTWSLMCRYFPNGCNVLGIEMPKQLPLLRCVAATSQGKLSVCLINLGTEESKLSLKLPQAVNHARLYRYCENDRPVDKQGFPVPAKTDISGRQIKLTLPPLSVMLLTELNF